MPGDPSAYDLPTGGILDDVDVTIQACIFRTDAGYNDGKSLLAVMDMSQDLINEISVQMYSIGGDWITPDGGLTIQSPKGSRGPSKQSNYGRFILAAVEIPELYQVLLSRGNPTDGRIWDGIKVRLKAFEHQYTFRGEERTTTHILPTVFNGVDSPGRTTPVGVAPQPSMPLVPAATPVVPTNNGVAATDPALHQRLTFMAKTAPDHTTFLASLSALPEVMSDDALIQSLMDTGPGGFFAIAKAS